MLKYVWASACHKRSYSNNNDESLTANKQVNEAIYHVGILYALLEDVFHWHCHKKRWFLDAQ